MRPRTAAQSTVGATRQPGLRHRFARSPVAACYRRGVEIELMHRAFGFGALGFVTLVPLLIVVGAAAPINGHSFPEWIVAGLGLSGRAAKAVNGLFGPAGRVLSTTTAFSLAVLAVFGLSFVASVQTGLERAWEMPPARIYSVWRRVVWLAALVGFLLGGAETVAFLHGPGAASVLRGIASAVIATLFFWWTVHFLLDGRIRWHALLPGALFTVAGLIGLRLFSIQVFSPLIVSGALTYGAIGTVLILVSWLIGLGFVIFGGTLVGRVVYEMGHERAESQGEEPSPSP